MKFKHAIPINIFVKPIVFTRVPLNAGPVDNESLISLKFIHEITERLRTKILKFFDAIDPRLIQLCYQHLTIT